MSNSASVAPATTPPVAPKRPQTSTLHGETRADDYGWLRDKGDHETMAYLDAENAYTEAMTADSKSFQETLYQEILGRIQQTDMAVPYRKGSYLYFSRTVEGQQYPLFCRRKATPDAPEEILLDLNAMAEGLAFMSLGDFEVSPDETKLAYSTDSTGYRQYMLHVKDLITGEVLPDTAERATSIAWASDSRTLFYTQEDDVSKRSHRLYRHVLGGDHDLAHEEADERFGESVHLTRSGEWLIHTIASHTTSETRVLAADRPDGEWTLIAPRQQDIEYYVDHRFDRFYIRVNDMGRNFRIVTAPVTSPQPAHWTELVAHRDAVMLSDQDCFVDHLVLSERENALPHIAVRSFATGATRRVSFPEAAYSVGPSANAEFATRTFRYAYQSFVTPPSVYDLDLDQFHSELLKRQPVLGGWDGARYAIERISATADDGTQVPISLVYRKGVTRDGQAPCLLYAYGSYGISSNVTFSSVRFSLLDRGAIFALAHIRGGGDLGKKWHDAARMGGKMTTFTDFIACGEHLIAQRYTAANRLVIQGGSAGGLLMGVVTNLRPDLFAGVFSQVPFVDVINTMLDESLPLTVGEFEEWGNPKVLEHYQWMKAYSPYDNLTKRAYPEMLIKTGLNDSQVGYWEPTKYVAKLRTMNTAPTTLLYKIDMGAGHGGASGRYDALRDAAFDYAWVLGRMGLANSPPMS